MFLQNVRVHARKRRRRGDIRSDLGGTTTERLRSSLMSSSELLVYVNDIQILFASQLHAHPGIRCLDHHVKLHRFLRAVSIIVS